MANTAKTYICFHLLRILDNTIFGHKPKIGLYKCQCFVVRYRALMLEDVTIGICTFLKVTSASFPRYISSWWLVYLVKKIKNPPPTLLLDRCCSCVQFIISAYLVSTVWCLVDDIHIVKCWWIRQKLLPLTNTGHLAGRRTLTFTQDLKNCRPLMMRMKTNIEDPYWP